MLAVRGAPRSRHSWWLSINPLILRHTTSSHGHPSFLLYSCVYFPESPSRRTRFTVDGLSVISVGTALFLISGRSNPLSLTLQTGSLRFLRQTLEPSSSSSISHLYLPPPFSTWNSRIALVQCSPYHWK